ncbi:MAG: InlB B-repeat-containing protein, partial [Clostridia bacterium]|nr:InlB B-repeat-containing protein [Clostridia bacterium]
MVLKASDTYSRTGYTFKEWIVDGATVSNNAFTMPAKAVTVTADWTINKYTVTYYNGYEDAAVGTDEYDYNAEVTIRADFTRTGYTFAGWTYDPAVTVTGGKFNMPAEDVTITATWTINEYKVTYYNGYEEDAKYTDTYDYKAEVAVRADFTRNGYTFAGWTYNPTVSVANGKFNMPAEDVTITATWTRNTIEWVDPQTKTGVYGDDHSWQLATPSNGYDGETYTYTSSNPAFAISNSGVMTAASTLAATTVEKPYEFTVTATASTGATKTISVKVTINKAQLTATVGNVTVDYDEDTQATINTAGVTYTGFVNGEVETSVIIGSPVYTVEGSSPRNVGEYD